MEIGDASGIFIATFFSLGIFCKQGKSAVTTAD
jgi:hypothetical protein